MTQTREDMAVAIACVPVVDDDGVVVWNVIGLDHDGKRIATEEGMAPEEIYSRVLGGMCTDVVRKLREEWYGGEKDRRELA